MAREGVWQEKGCGKRRGVAREGAWQEKGCGNTVSLGIKQSFLL